MREPSVCLVLLVASSGRRLLNITVCPVASSCFSFLLKWNFTLPLGINNLGYLLERFQSFFDFSSGSPRWYLRIFWRLPSLCMCMYNLYVKIVTSMHFWVWKFKFESLNFGCGKEFYRCSNATSLCRAKKWRGFGVDWETWSEKRQDEWLAQNLDLKIPMVRCKNRSELRMEGKRSFWTVKREALIIQESFEMKYNNLNIVICSV